MSYFTDMFKSKEEKEKRSQEYVQLVFPLGLEQRDRVREIIKEMFPKHLEEVVLFNYIAAKEYYIVNKNDEGSKRSIKQLSKIRPKLKSDQMMLIYALMITDIGVKNLNEYPRLEELKNIAEQYREIFVK